MLMAVYICVCGVAQEAALRGSRPTNLLAEMNCVRMCVCVCARACVCVCVCVCVCARARAYNMMFSISAYAV